jgi:hypothetical protein
VAEKTKKRGGASAPCPKCGANSHVVVTQRQDGDVIRVRKCKRYGHEFRTKEFPVAVLINAARRQPPGRRRRLQFVSLRRRG